MFRTGYTDFDNYVTVYHSKDIKNWESIQLTYHKKGCTFLVGTAEKAGKEVLAGCFGVKLPGEFTNNNTNSYFLPGNTYEISVSFIITYSKFLALTSFKIVQYMFVIINKEIIWVNLTLFMKIRWGMVKKIWKLLYNFIYEVLMIWLTTIYNRLYLLKILYIYMFLNIFDKFRL